MKSRQTPVKTSRKDLGNSDSSNRKNRTTTPKPHDDVFKEKDRIAKLGRLRQFVFGSLDGLLVPLGVVSEVAGGTGNLKL